MGANVSVESCQAGFNITLNCSATPGQNWGNVTRGEFEPDPDVAGIGIVSVFIAVTSLALIIGYVDVLWQVYKSFVKKKGKLWQLHANKPRGERTQPSVSDILEAIVISCSDQQLFTGGAYALTVRYFKGCSVSAYHYNVLVNGLLITCATHLVAVTVVMNYWRYPLMALLRVAITVLIFLVTGLLLTKQTGTGYGSFPFAVPTPADDAAGSPLFMAAACFEADIGQTGLASAVQSSLDHLNHVLHGPNQAWTLYLFMLLWWSLAIVAELFRFLHRGSAKEAGRRRAVVTRVRSWATAAREDGRPNRKRLAGLFRRLFHFCYVFYLVTGLGISSVVVVLSALYIQGLRSWVDRSGWLDRNQAGRNPENDVTTFGQLVPILMTALTLFAFMQMLSEKLADARRKKRAEDEARSRKLDDPYRDDKSAGVVYSITSVAPTPHTDNDGGVLWSGPGPAAADSTPALDDGGSSSPPNAAQSPTKSSETVLVSLSETKKQSRLPAARPKLSRSRPESQVTLPAAEGGHSEDGAVHTK